MKNITRKFIIGAALVIGSLLPVAVQADGNQGHHQSGIIGRVPVEQFGLHILWKVRVSTDSFKPIKVLQPDADGQFVVNLKPGTYRLTLFAGEDGGVQIVGALVRVTVEKKDFTVVDFVGGPS